MTSAGSRDRPFVVAQFVNTLDMGGATDFAINLAERLRGDSFRTAIVAGPGDAWLDRVRSLDVPLHRLDTFAPTHLADESGSVAGDLRATYGLARWLRANSVDVLHCHSSKARVIGAVAAKFAGTPLVVQSAHGFAFANSRTVLSRTARFSLEFLAGRLSDVLIVENRHDLIRSRDLALNRGGEVRLVPTGIEPFRELPTKHDARSSLGLDGYDHVILFVGRIGEQKNPRVFFEVAKQLVERRNVAVAVVGEGPLADEARADCRDHPAIHFFGEQRDLGPFFAAADLYLLPSLWEGVPITVLYALASGVPVVSSDVGGLPDVVVPGITGYTNDPNDVDAHVDAVERLVDADDARRTMAINGCELIDANHRMEQMIERHERIYLDGLLRHGRFGG